MSYFSRSEENGLRLLKPSDQRVLSVGISTAGGAEVRMLESSESRTIVATTLDSSGIANITSILKAQGLSDRVEVRLEDISDPHLSYHDDEFDYVYARLVLHYLSAQQLRTALESLRRVVKPKGRLFVVVRSTDCAELKDGSIDFNESTRLTTYRTPSGTVASRYFHTQESISKAIEDAGFKVENIQSFDEELSPGFMRNTNIWVTNNLIEVLASKPASRLSRERGEGEA